MLRDRRAASNNSASAPAQSNAVTGGSGTLQDLSWCRPPRAPAPRPQRSSDLDQCRPGIAQRQNGCDQQHAQRLHECPSSNLARRCGATCKWSGRPPPAALINGKHGKQRRGQSSRRCVGSGPGPACASQLRLCCHSRSHYTAAHTPIRASDKMRVAVSGQACRPRRYAQYGTPAQRRQGHLVRRPNFTRRTHG
jgi:hypothetical protein